MNTAPTHDPDSPKIWGHHEPETDPERAHSLAGIAMPPPSPAKALEIADPLGDELLEAGVHPDAIPAVKRIFEFWLEANAISRALVIASETMRAVCDKLRDTPAGAALHRVLFGKAGKSLRDAAKTAKCNASTVLHHEKKIRGKIGAYFA